MEQLKRTKFAGGESFHYWTFVTLVSALTNVVVAYLSLRVSRSHKEAVAVEQSQSQFAWVALAQSLASATALSALQYVDFPTQTLGKCAKPISVLVVGLFFPGTKYTLKKAITAMLVCAGIAVFFLGKESSGSSGSASSFSLLGVGLIAASLLCDGLVGGLQSRIRSQADKRKPSPSQMMFFINAWSMLLIGVLLLFNGELLPSLAFLGRHPATLLPLVGLALSMAIGQLFIYLLVTEFDPLVCSLTTTTRKFFSILGSVVVYGSPVFFWQWVGIGLVFAGLLLPELQGMLQRMYLPKQHKL